MRYLIAGFLCLAVMDLFSQNEEVSKGSLIRTYQTKRLVGNRPVIDGNLNDECWNEGTWTGDFVQWTPNEGAEPNDKTEAKILYDSRNIYVAIRLYDKEPEKISVKASRRDQLNGDAVGVAFDSYHDHRTGFEFDVSAFGQKTDMVMTNPIVCDFNWNAVWSCKTGLEDSAWVAEFEIPFSQLRYSNEAEQSWGLHIWRWIDRLREESDWEPLTNTGPGLIYQFGHLNGLTDLPKLKRIELMPYALGTLETFEKQSGNPFAENGTNWNGSLGLDAKIGLSSNFTADVTINPDFGQVEADPSQMNLTAFETFFEEKRPFFLEGGSIFKFNFDGINLFYSRRIGHKPTYMPATATGEYLDLPESSSILGAAKLSGKTAKGLSVGIMQSLTSKEFAKIWNGSGTIKTAVEPMTNYTVARVQQDFEEGTTTLGGIITSTNRFINEDRFEYLPQNSFTGGIDLFHQWKDKKYFVDARLIGSSVNGSKEAINLLQRSSARYFQRADVSHLQVDTLQTVLSGHGGQIRVGKGSKGLWRYSTEINWRSPGLELNDLGFMQMADIFNVRNALSYFVNKPVSIFRTYSVNLDQGSNWDYGFNYLSSNISLAGNFEFKNKWGISPSYSYTTEATDNRLLRGGGSMVVPSLTNLFIHLNSDQSKRLYFIVNLSNNRMSGGVMNYWNISPHVIYQPISTLRFLMGASYAENINDLQFVSTSNSDGTDRYMLGRIDQKELGAVFRIDYNLTPELSLQYYGSPFASVGRYDRFKLVTDPLNDRYEDRFQNITPALNGNEYQVADDAAPSYSFKNPDFNFSQFRSNLVFRWEYRQGSLLYLVWSNERTFYNSGSIGIKNAIEGLQNELPKNLFLLKWTYWFSV